MKTLIRIALTAAVLSLLAACGAKGPLFMPKPAPTEEAPIEAPAEEAVPTEQPAAEPATTPATTP